MKTEKIVLIGGGVGSSTFTKALKNLPVELTTIVSAFDDGGSTGAIRRDYGGFALGDFRQCIFAHMDLDEKILKSLNYRFGAGNLYGVNVGNILIRAFLDTHPSEADGVESLHRLLKLKHQVIPISYVFAKLRAKLANGVELADQQQVADYLSFSSARIKSIFLDRKAVIAPDAKQAILQAKYISFVPGHFFTSVLPHLSVTGFDGAWKKSKAKKIWFVNLLAHHGQDSFYTLKDYLAWFQKKLGRRPFDMVVINQKVPQRILRRVEDRFCILKTTPKDLAYIRSLKMQIQFADLVSPTVRGQQANDTVLRAPLRHDPEKISLYFEKILRSNS